MATVYALRIEGTHKGNILAPDGEDNAVFYNADDARTAARMLTCILNACEATFSAVEVLEISSP